MKRKWIPAGIAAGLAALLALAYLLLPVESRESYYNNSGRKKLELEAGETYAWSWRPEKEGTTAVELHLSGMKKAQGVTLFAEIRDAGGTQIASREQKIADLGEAEDSVWLEGDFRRSESYTLSVRAEGEGALKLKGENDEETEEFFPFLGETSASRKYNPVILYFACGLLIAGAAALCGAERTGRRARETRAVNRVLPWVTFLLVGGIGLMITWLKPMPEFGPGGLAGWDEEIHWMHVQAMDLRNPGGLRFLAADLITWNPGYVPLAIGYNLAKLFSAADEAAYRTAIGFSAVCYAAMCALAVARAPRYKASFLAAGTMPVFFYLATCMSYDTVVAGSILLGTALLMETLDREEKMSAFRGVTMISLLGFGTVAKPAYSLALLGLMLIPGEKFASRGRKWIFRALVILMLAWCLCALAMPGAYDDVREGDARFAETSLAGQLEYMKAHPLEGGLYPFRHMWDRQVYLTKAGISDWYSLGSSGTVDSIYLWLMLILAPLCTIGERKGGKPLLTPGRRVTLGALALGAETMLAYAQYLVSSPVGGTMQGLQARYFMPVWILLMLALMWPRRIRERMGRMGEWAAIPVWGVCLGVNLWNVIGHMTQLGVM